MEDIKTFINENILYIYKVYQDGCVFVISILKEKEGYTAKAEIIENNNESTSELEKNITEGIAATKDVKFNQSKEDLCRVLSSSMDIPINQAETILSTFVIPEKKQTNVQSILADILNLSYKERSEILVALIDMM